MADKQKQSLTELMELAQSQVKLEAEVGRIEQQLAAKNKELARIQLDLLPTAMKELGMDEFKLADGSKITRKSDVKCSISEANAPAAMEWLIQNHHDGIIKSNLLAEFDIGDTKQRDKAVAALAKLKLHPQVSMKVHPSTLKSFVKECFENGIDIPVEPFGIFQYDKAVVTLPKGKK